MSNLEQYIKENRSAFDSGPMPNNHKEMFFNKLQLQKKNKLNFRKKILWVAGSVAASILVVIFIGKVRINFGENGNYNKLMVQTYNTQMDEEENAVIEIVKRVRERDLRSVELGIKSIKEDVIPFTDLLPDELTASEKDKIIKQYYMKKIEGIKRFKEYYLSIDNNQ
jgi:hypothetical protein